MIRLLLLISILTVVFPFLATAQEEPITVIVVKSDAAFAKMHPLVQQFWEDFQASGGKGEIIEVRLSANMRQQIGQFMANLFEGHFIRVERSPTRLAVARQSAFNQDKIVLERLSQIEKQGYSILGLPPDRITVNAAVISTDGLLPEDEKNLTLILNTIFLGESGGRAFIFGPNTNADTMIHEQVHIDQKKTDSRMNKFLSANEGLVEDSQKKWTLKKLIQEIDAYSIQLDYLNGLPQSTIFNTIEVDESSAFYRLKTIPYENYLQDWYFKTSNALKYHSMGLDRYFVKKEKNSTFICSFVDTINKAFPILQIDYREILVLSYPKDSCLIKN